MAVRPGICRILNGRGSVKMVGAGKGRQREKGASFPYSAARCCASASAQGRIGNSPGLKSAARFTRYFGGGSCRPSSPCVGTSHVPERSGFLSRVFGAGEERLGFPLFNRGTPET